ncbi:MAG: hypothetical protein LBK55_08730, partial [Azoarcus sp.]|nr:hypothetical protein [Azoarcus sp.]
RNGLPLPSGRLAPWLKEAPTHPLQQTLKDLERAYRNFFETPRCSLWRDGAVGPLNEAGTRRSDSIMNNQVERRRNPLPLGRGGCQYPKYIPMELIR